MVLRTPLSSPCKIPPDPNPNPNPNLTVTLTLTIYRGGVEGGWAEGGAGEGFRGFFLDTIFNIFIFFIELVLL